MPPNASCTAFRPMVCQTESWEANPGADGPIEESKQESTANVFFPPLNGSLSITVWFLRSTFVHKGDSFSYLKSVGRTRTAVCTRSLMTTWLMGRASIPKEQCYKIIEREPNKTFSVSSSPPFMFPSIPLSHKHTHTFLLSLYRNMCVLRFDIFY